MLVLSHRGYWLAASEKNTLGAFCRSFEQGFGTETDVRDRLGKVVIAHDPPNEQAIEAEVVFDAYRRCPSLPPLALNVKADGLQRSLLPLLESFGVTNYFVFDMSVPDALGWIRAGAPTFTRQSDIEPDCVLYREAAGVWLDAFHRDWWSSSVIRRHLDAGKQVCVVSPELHGREYRGAWDELAKLNIESGTDCMLCTDRPLEAREFFGG